MVEKQQKKEEYAQIVKSTGLLGGVQGITLFVSLVKNKVIAVLLGTSGIGLISVLNSIITMVGSFTNIGISSSAVREVAEVIDQKDNLQLVIKKVRNWSALTAIIGTLIGLISAPLLSVLTFNNYDYTFSLMMLSPVIGLTSFSGGELALLKGISRLNQIALISIYGSILVICISIPLYCWLGMEGIVSSLLFSAIAMACLTAHYSFKYMPLKISDYSFVYLRKGSNLIKLGISMVFAAILGSLVEYIIRLIMLKSGDTSMVGLYNAGYAIVVTYAGLIFVAMSTDYFPRLSAVNRDTKQMMILINRQIEITLLLITPVVVILVLFSPLIIPLLYADSFLPVVGMIQFASLNLLLRAFIWPIEYAALAKGDSLLYLFQEFSYNVFFVLVFLLGYDFFEIKGAGLALSVSAIFNLIVVSLVGYFRYGYIISKEVFNIVLLIIPFYVSAIIIILLNISGILYWGISSICVISCLSLSLYLLNKSTDIIPVLFNKILKKK